MEVILLKDVKGIGKAGQTVNVKDGYASNYLIPHKLAVKLTARSQEVLDQQNADKEAKRQENIRIAKEVAKKLEGIVVEFTANTGADGKMFGTISTKQIEEQLKSKYEVVIDKRKFIDKTAVDRLGYTKLEIELFKGVNGVVTVHVSEKK